MSSKSPAYLPIVTGQIRVLNLLPSTSKTDPIVVELESVSLEDEPIYEALSYVWGTEQSHHQLEVHFLSNRENATDTTAVSESYHQILTRSSALSLPMTKNLDIALRCLRSSEQPRRLWVDAVCIDQTHIAERNAQVRQMRRIYSSAARVVIWLGEPVSHTSLAFDVFDEIGLDTTVLRPFDALPTDTFNAIVDILDRPWWNRRWVVQEAALARNAPLIVCGHRSTEFTNLISFTAAEAYAWNTGPVVNFQHEGYLSKRRSDQIPDGAPFPRTWFRWVDQDPFDLIKAGGEQEATDPRDHVYALLGMAIQWFRDTIVVDYGLTVLQVYQNATFAIITYRNSLDSLITLDLGQKHDRTLNLPSWTIDFSSHNNDPLTQHTPNSVVRGLEWGFQRGHKASGTRPGLFQHDTKLSTLSVEGVVVGTVKKALCTSTTKPDLLLRWKTSRLGEAIETFHSRLGVTFEQLQDLLDQACSHGLSGTRANRPSSTTQDLYRLLVAGNREFGVRDTPFDFDLIARTLRLSRTGTSTSTSTSQMGTRQDVLSQSHETATAAQDPGILATLSDAEKQNVLQYLKDAVLCAHWGSSYLAIDRGWVGLSSRRAREGDVVAIVFATTLPVVLRPVQDTSGRSWRFVAFAYVSGAMEGEMVRDDAEVAADTTVFRIV